MKDLQSMLGPVVSIAAAAITSTQNGDGVDLQGFNSAAVIITPGTITDGTHTPKVEESDDNSAWSDVAAADLVGSLSALASDTVQKVGYKGTKRYIRVTSTVAGASSGGVYAAVVVRGHPNLAPVE